MARLARRVLEADLEGAFNLAGPRLTWVDFVRVIGTGHPVRVSRDTLEASAAA